MEYFYSAEYKSFYAGVLRKNYEAAGTWPGDAVPVDENEFAAFSGAPPAGKTRGSDDKGLPAWINLPKKTPEEITAEAEREKQNRIDMVRQSVSLIQTKLLMGRKLSEDEKERMEAALDYIDALEAINTSNVQEIIWPEMPENVE